MIVVMSGTAQGMGQAAAMKFLENGYTVYGIDIKESTITHNNYTHYVRDVGDYDSLPDIENVDILVNNAGSSNSGSDIQTNLIGTINCTVKYGLQPNIKSILNQASVCATNGQDFPAYVASKGGVKAFTIWTAKQVAKYGAVCNSLSFGGVYTELNGPVIEDDDSMKEIMDLTVLKKWIYPAEAAEWIYFFAAVNKSATGQDMIIDNGECIHGYFVWPGFDKGNQIDWIKENGIRL